MAKKNILKRILPLCLLIAAAAAVGMTGASVLHTMSLENPIKTPPVEGEVNEDEMEGHVKNTRFENTGEADVFLRVSYAESWNHGEGEDAVTLPLQAKTTEGGEVRVASPQWNASEVNNWAEKDGWLYYKKVLKAGEKTEPIVTSVEFLNAADLAKLVEADAYKNGSYDLHFVMEIVQASDDAAVSKAAIQEVWGSAVVPQTLPSESDETWNKSGTLTWRNTTAWKPVPTPGQKN